MPDLLDRIDVEPERLGQRDLGEPRRDADAQRAGGELEQGEAAAGVEMVEHRGERARRLGPAERGEPLDHVGEPQRAVVEIGRLVRRRSGQSSDTVSAMSPT